MFAELIAKQQRQRERSSESTGRRMKQRTRQTLEVDEVDVFYAKLNDTIPYATS